MYGIPNDHQKDTGNIFLDAVCNMVSVALGGIYENALPMIFV